ncbi:MAG: hypothetical protein IPI73_25915 [Betaproteobacteria bacterium]|nr:hypothetical protein [Betaproteobacteria bacterium]
MDKHDHRQAQEESIRRFGHPFGMLCCVSTESFTMLSATSGTSGTPTFYTLTEPDLKIYSELMARKLRLIGLRPGDRVLHGFALSMMVGGQAVLQLLKNYGACIVPVGAEVGSRRLLEFARLVRPRMLICTPSYAEYVAEKCQETLGIPRPILASSHRLRRLSRAPVFPMSATLSNRRMAQSSTTIRRGPHLPRHHLRRARGDDALRFRGSLRARAAGSGDEGAHRAP